MKNVNNIEALSQSELENANGGLLGVVIGAAIAYAAIGATVAWNMAKDNREC